MRVLITGAGGFIGSHLVDHFAPITKKGELVATYFQKGFRNIEHLKDRIRIEKLDINDKPSVKKLIKELETDVIFHMAAQSYVMPSWKDPEGTFTTNIIGTLNIFEAVRSLGLDTRIVMACSSAEYGINTPEEVPIKETKKFRPSSPYAVSKIGQDMLGYLYWLNFGMNIVRIRYFNIVGPRKAGNLCADFAKGIAEIEAGKRKSLGVGPLNPIIDLTDIRDVVNATVLLSEKGEYDEAYNVCTGKGHKVGEILDMFVGLSKSRIDIMEDPAKKRPKEDPIFIGDNTRLKSLGWRQKYTIEDSVKSTLDYWRNEIMNS